MQKNVSRLSMVTHNILDENQNHAVIANIDEKQ